MSQPESFEYRGKYDQLSPQLVDEAYLLNEAHDIHAPALEIEAKAHQLELDRRAQYFDDIDALVNSAGLSHDGFLEAYDEALLKIDYSSPARQEFERMKELRSSLLPGVFLKTLSGNIVTIAQPQDDTDPNYGIRPVLVRTNAAVAQFEERINFYWQVPVEEYDSPLLVNNYVRIGKKAIAKELDKKLHSPLGRQFSDDEYALQLSEIASQYRIIGKDTKAQRLEEEAIGVVHTLFGKKLFNRSSKISESVIEQNLSLLYKLDRQHYDDVISRVKQYAAQGTIRDKVLAFVEAYAKTEALFEAIERGDKTYFPPTPAEVAQLYAQFTAEGEALLAQKQQDAKNFPGLEG